MIFVAEEKYKGLLENLGLKTEDDFLSFKNEFCYKRNHYRAVYKISINGHKNVFLKIYDRLSPKMIWDMLAGGRVSESRKESDNFRLVSSLGIKTLKPIGYGEKRVLGVPIKSFLLTESLETLPRFEDVVAKFWGKFPFKKKKILISEVAEMVYALHSRNIFHKDLYLGHILYEEAPDKSTHSLYLIDLQRIKKHNISPGRWRVKDLASLNYSADLCGIGIKDRIRFLRQYCSLSGEPYRRYVAPVFRKSEKIKKHTIKHFLRKHCKKRGKNGNC
jgi:heptose I phosphotransferase